MARKRSKTRDRTKKKRDEKPDLTMKEMLDRIPKGKEFLTTKEVQHVMNDCHEVSVYRYVQQGLLTPHRTWGKKANRYPRKEVAALIKSKFTPRPVSETESGADANRSQAKKKARSKTKKGGGVRAKKT